MSVKSTIDKKRLLASPEAAQSLGISERLLWSYAAAGHLRKTIIGKRGVRFTPSDLDAFTNWLNEGGTL